KSFLQERLPYYMVPSYFISIKELPITANGKIDRKALPRITQPLGEKEYIEPQTNTQKKLVLIWQKTLGIRNIGIKSNFYDLGGTSLLAVQLVIDIYNVFHLEVNLQELGSSILDIEALGFLIDKKVNGAKTN